MTDDEGAAGDGSRKRSSKLRYSSRTLPMRCSLLMSQHPTNRSVTYNRWYCEWASTTDGDDAFPITMAMLVIVFIETVVVIDSRWRALSFHSLITTSRQARTISASLALLLRALGGGALATLRIAAVGK